MKRFRINKFKDGHCEVQRYKYPLFLFFIFKYTKKIGWRTWNGYVGSSKYEVLWYSDDSLSTGEEKARRAIEKYILEDFKTKNSKLLDKQISL